MVGADKPVFVVVGGHPTDKAKQVEKYVQSLNGKLKLFVLLPYSPQLNPDETVWAHVKREIIRKTVNSLEDNERSCLECVAKIVEYTEISPIIF